MPKSWIYDIAEHFRSFALLRVLDLRNCKLIHLPEGIVLLVHLRYLAIRRLLSFPSSLLNLTSLQTLIVRTNQSYLLLPSNISDLVNLRHLSSNKFFYLPSINRSMNLQTISEVKFGDLVGKFQKYFPVIKKISLILNSDEGNDFEVLPYLETLKLTRIYRRKLTEPELPKGEPNCRNSFPKTLKKLTLVRCHLPWSDMSIIQSLPNFEWEAYSINFPSLKQLEIVKCRYLEEATSGVRLVCEEENEKEKKERKRLLKIVTRVKVMRKHGYGYLREIEVWRADNDLYTFKEGDFPTLRINDIKDMLIIIIQNKLTNLSGDDVSDFAIALLMFTRSMVIQMRVEDLQLGVESYQKKINVTKPETTRPDIRKKEPYTLYQDP
ncbi:disease resistance protein [Tanacetum coccineum]